MRFVCSTFGDGFVGVWVSDDHLIVITAELPGDDPVDANTAVGPKGNCACRTSAAIRILRPRRRTPGRSSGFLESRLAEIGVCDRVRG